MFDIFNGMSKEEVMGMTEVYKDVYIINYLMENNLEIEAYKLLNEFNNLVHSLGFPHAEFNMQELLEMKTMFDERTENVIVNLTKEEP